MDELRSHLSSLRAHQLARRRACKQRVTAGRPATIISDYRELRAIDERLHRLDFALEKLGPSLRGHGQD